MSDLFQQIRQLSVPEQLHLVEKIWDGLHDDRAIVQQWHRDEGRSRLTDLERDPTQTIDRVEMWTRVDKLSNE